MRYDAQVHGYPAYVLDELKKRGFGRTRPEIVKMIIAAYVLENAEHLRNAGALPSPRRDLMKKAVDNLVQTGFYGANPRDVVTRIVERWTREQYRSLAAMGMTLEDAKEKGYVPADVPRIY